LPSAADAKDYIENHAFPFMKPLCLLLGLALPLQLWAGQLNQGNSPSGKIHFELRGQAQDSKEIWLSPADHKDQGVKLCDTQGWGNLEVHFSPDDCWIIVQDG